MKKRIILFLFLFSLFFVPVSSAAASQDIQPQDPGVGSLQDAVIQETINWSIKQPLALNYPIFNVAETFDRTSLDPIALKTGSSGNLLFTGFDASQTMVNSFNPVAFSSFDPFIFGTMYPPPPPSNNCDSTTTPGIISLTASLTAPTHPVVVTQDPNRTGVNLTWTINILPTVYTYGVWEQVIFDNGHCKNMNAECQINNSGKACCVGLICVPNNPSSGNGKCGIDNNAAIWACVDHTIIYKENIATLTPKAILAPSSRSWILNVLARAYPGTILKHPDWGFTATEPCIWVGDVCVWTHSEGGVQVVDPGWYDLQVSGMTAGTDITDPRVFTLTGGQFGVYLIETTKTGQQ